MRETHFGFPGHPEGPSRASRGLQGGCLPGIRPRAARCGSRGQRRRTRCIAAAMPHGGIHTPDRDGPPLLPPGGPGRNPTRLPSPRDRHDDRKADQDDQQHRPYRISVAGVATAPLRGEQGVDHHLGLAGPPLPSRHDIASHTSGPHHSIAPSPPMTSPVTTSTARISFIRFRAPRRTLRRGLSHSSCSSRSRATRRSQDALPAEEPARRRLESRILRRRLTGSSSMRRLAPLRTAARRKARPRCARIRGAGHLRSSAPAPRRHGD